MSDNHPKSEKWKEIRAISQTKTNYLMGNHDGKSNKLTIFSMTTYELNNLFGWSDIASSYNDSPVVFNARAGLSFDPFLFSRVGLTVLATLLPLVSVPVSERVLVEVDDDEDMVASASSTGSCLI